MLDLKSKLLAAGLVTAEQVKKVEDDEAKKKQRDKERREAQRQGGRDHRDARKQGHGGGHGAHGGARDRKRDDKDEKRAHRDHKEEEAQRWRKRLDELKAAPKSEQYDAIRGWVVRHRLDDKSAVPSENASRFHFAKGDGTIGHVTLEPEVQQKLAAAEAGIVGFMGYNGVEHAVVPADLARDIGVVKPEWLRSLAGVTDVSPPPNDELPEAPPEEAQPASEDVLALAAPTDAVAAGDADLGAAAVASAEGD